MRVLNIRSHVATAALNNGTAISIMRPNSWGNPFKIGQHGTRDDVVAKYRAWLPTQPRLMARLHELVGFDLVCCCTPLPCHGDVLLDAVQTMLTARATPPAVIDEPLPPLDDELMPPPPTPAATVTPLPFD